MNCYNIKIGEVLFWWKIEIAFISFVKFRERHLNYFAPGHTVFYFEIKFSIRQRVAHFIC